MKILICLIPLVLSLLDHTLSNTIKGVPKGIGDSIQSLADELPWTKSNESALRILNLPEWCITIPAKKMKKMNQDMTIGADIKTYICEICPSLVATLDVLNGILKLEGSYTRHSSGQGMWNNLAVPDPSTLIFKGRGMAMCNGKYDMTSCHCKFNVLSTFVSDCKSNSDKNMNYEWSIDMWDVSIGDDSGMTPEEKQTVRDFMDRETSKSDRDYMDQSMTDHLNMNNHLLG